MFEGWNIPRRERRFFSFPPSDNPATPTRPRQQKLVPKKPKPPSPPQRCEIFPPGWRRGFSSQKERDEFAMRAFHPGGDLYDPRYRESEVFLKTDGHCAYCWVKPATTIDHMTATSRGGNNSRSNLIGACHQCNNDKAALSVEEFRIKRGVKAFPFETYEKRDTSAATQTAAG